MFLNSLRSKTIYRKIRKESESRSFTPLSTQIKSIAILQTDEMQFTKAGLQQLAQIFKIKESAIRKMSLIKSTEEKQEENSSTFSEKQIGWNGVIKSDHIKEFTRTPFDILINYYDKDILPLVALTTFSKAHMKIGFSEDLMVMNDLVISVSLNNEKLLLEEVEKYMRILNRIS